MTKNRETSKAGTSKAAKQENYAFASKHEKPQHEKSNHQKKLESFIKLVA